MRFAPLTFVAAFVICGIAGLSSVRAADDSPATGAKPIRVLALTGGHPYNEKEFPKLFEGYDDIQPTQVRVDKGGEAFDDVQNFPYDVIVFYIYDRTINEAEQKNLLKLLDKGVGVVVLHHSNYAYNNWPEFSKISGVTWYDKEEKKDGETHPASTWKGKTKYTIHVADPNHPITRGLTDYKFQDETYGRQTIDPSVHPLLTTDEKTSDKYVAWVKTYGNAKVCYIQAGHDEKAWKVPSYRQVVANAIRWVAGRLPEAASDKK